MKTRVKNLLYIVAALMWAMGSTALFAQSDARLERELSTIMGEYDAVGLSVVVIKDNQVHYTKALGFSDLEKKTPLHEDHIFRIASISKSFTSAALLKLVEQGKVRLDDNVSDLIGFPVVNPKYPDVAITLQMLLSHTSSLNDTQKYGNLDIINPAKGATYEKCYSDYAPGTQFRYCNLGYNMAGAILEKLHNKRFDEVIRHEILEPLGMEAGFNVDSLDQSRFAQLYRWDRKEKLFTKSKTAYNNSLIVYRTIANNRYVLGYTGARFSPTGGLKVSAPDLAKYMQMHMNYGEYNGKRVLSESISKLIQTPHAERTEDRDYGLGLLVARDVVEGKTLIGHTGSAQGLLSAMFFDPNEKYGFVVVTNGMKPAGRPHPILGKTIKALHAHFIGQ